MDISRIDLMRLCQENKSKLTIRCNSKRVVIIKELQRIGVIPQEDVSDKKVGIKHEKLASGRNNDAINSEGAVVIESEWRRRNISPAKQDISPSKKNSPHPPKERHHQKKYHYLLLNPNHLKKYGYLQLIQIT